MSLYVSPRYLVLFNKSDLRQQMVWTSVRLALKSVMKIDMASHLEIEAPGQRERVHLQSSEWWHGHQPRNWGPPDSESHQASEAMNTKMLITINPTFHQRQCKFQ